jgi:ornithine carbamoyltransferase
MTHFLNLSDFSSSEAESLLQEALSLKNNKDNNNPLKGKYLALIFEKASTRTRVSFEVGMTQLGGKAGFLSTSDLQLGRGEPIEDTARVISSMADAVVLRTISHETLNLFADHSSVPVINGLTNLSHPCQLLADLLTFYECKGEIRDAKVTWVGDYNNVCFSYVEASKLFQFNLEIACPKTYWPSTEVMQETSATFTEDLKAAVKESDLITTDVWVSMGDEADSENRIKEFNPYQVSPAVMDLAKTEAIFLHCLPAIRGQEVSENMLEDPRSKVWVQAENRLHAQKALLLKLLNH